MDFFSNITNLMLLALALLSGGLLAWPALTRKHGTLSPTDATRFINRHHAIIIDIRSKDEFAIGHLPKAKYIPMDSLASKAESLSRNKEIPIIIVCRTGIQSSRACTVLKKAGYTAVFSLEGGIHGWQKADLPLIR